jgi:hypothetical protein
MREKEDLSNLGRCDVCGETIDLRDDQERIVFPPQDTAEEDPSKAMK